MGRDLVKQRHVVTIKGHQYWVPSKTLRDLGYSSERLPDDAVKQFARAKLLNDRADADRDAKRIIVENPLSATAIKTLEPLFIAACKARVADADLGVRTLADYEYDMGSIVAKWGQEEVADLTSKIIVAWLKALKKENAWTAYHLGLMLRTFLKWCAVEGLIAECPAFEVTKPPARRVKWTEEEVWEGARRLKAAGSWSLSVGLLVEWCIGQNPGDVWTLKRSHYINGCIDLVRNKTQVGGDPIPLWPDIRAELDAYLAENPATPDAPLLRAEFNGKAWNEQTRCRRWQNARAAEPAMRRELQMRDLRRTALSEAIGLGFSRDEARTLGRHSTAQGMDPYVEMSGSGAIQRVQAARSAARRKK